MFSCFLGFMVCELPPPKLSCKSSCVYAATNNVARSNELVLDMVVVFQTWHIRGLRRIWSEELQLSSHIRLKWIVHSVWFTYTSSANTQKGFFLLRNIFADLFTTTVHSDHNMTHIFYFAQALKSLLWKPLVLALIQLLCEMKNDVWKLSLWMLDKQGL